MMALLLSMQAVGADAGKASSSPWYTAWYLWIGLGVFIIVLVSIVGSGNKQGNDRD